MYTRAVSSELPDSGILWPIFATLYFYSPFSEGNLFKQRTTDHLHIPYTIYVIAKQKLQEIRMPRKRERTPMVVLDLDRTFKFDRLDRRFVQSRF